MFILINKPSGPTSHDIVNSLRKITGVKRIGHAGTLDPFAEGLLICAISRESTSLLGNFLKLDKTYLATLRLGVTSDSYDRTGNIVLSSPCQGSLFRDMQGRRVIDEPKKYYVKLTKKLIITALQKFIGEQSQTPPAFSAKKINGRKAYELARQGKPIDLKPNKITIYSIKILEIRNLELKIEVRCTSGTYIRSLAHDLGQTLGCGAILEKLVRTQIGGYNLKNAVSPDILTPKNWQKHCLPEIQNLKLALAPNYTWS